MNRLKLEFCKFRKENSIVTYYRLYLFDFLLKMEVYILTFLNMDLKHLDFVSYLCMKIDQ